MGADLFRSGGGFVSALVQRFTVDFDFPVRFTRAVFAVDNPVFLETVTRLEPDKRQRVLFVIDENLAKARPRLLPQIQTYCDAHRNRIRHDSEPVLVPGGEVAKNDLCHVLNLVQWMNELGIDRQSFVAIVGGGAVLDMSCFAAAICHRGIRAIRVPTTTLSQCDSGVGVKNGVNLFGKKNFIGTFVPPFAVLNDFEFIETLELRDKLAGIAEAVKVSLIRDRSFFELLEADAMRLARAEPDALSYSIRRAAELHLEHIRTSGDPFELGSARPLDFGHWSAHKLESLTRHRLRHGEAVALGMALDTIYSVKAGYFARADGERVLNLLETLGFALWDDALLTLNGEEEYMILEGLREFQEHLGGILDVTLPRGIGERFEVNEMDHGLILESIWELRRRFRLGCQAKVTPSSWLALGPYPPPATGTDL